MQQSGRKENGTIHNTLLIATCNQVAMVVFLRKKKKKEEEKRQKCASAFPSYEDEMDGINCPPMFAYTYLRGTRTPALRYPRLLI
jgi:hypothetical protein